MTTKATKAMPGSVLGLLGGPVEGETGRVTVPYFAEGDSRCGQQRERERERAVPETGG